MLTQKQNRENKTSRQTEPQTEQGALLDTQCPAHLIEGGRQLVARVITDQSVTGQFKEQEGRPRKHLDSCNWIFISCNLWFLCKKIRLRQLNH